MARIRTIKPGFWSNEDLSALPEATHMLAAALLNYADDDGLFNANPKLIAAECCPLREPSVSIHDSLTALSNIGYLKLGSGVDGKRYGLILKFGEHQRINRPTESKIKKIGIVWDDSLSPHGALTESSLLEGKGREEEGKKKDAAIAAPVPNSEETELYRRGKQILGSNAGGLIKNLIKAKQGSFALARAAIETASTKQDAREYIGGVINGGTGPPSDARERGDAW